MRNSRFFARKKLNEDMVLQITSMADIFTILLVFLLKSFSTGVSNLTPSNDLTLPSAKGGDEVADVLKVEISPNIILVDDKPITNLRNFKFDPADYESNRTSRSLNIYLSKEKKRRDVASAPSADSAAKMNSKKIMLLADEKTPYSTLKSVLSSAGMAGFVDFKLVVIEAQ